MILPCIFGHFIKVTVVWRGDYYPFGEIYDEQVSIYNDFRFPGQWHDRESNLYYNWHRYYNPEIGRYMTKNPIGLVGGINMYNYAHGNPITNIDPLGLWRLNLKVALGLGFTISVGNDNKTSFIDLGLTAGLGFNYDYDPFSGISRQTQIDNPNENSAFALGFLLRTGFSGSVGPVSYCKGYSRYTGIGVISTDSGLKGIGEEYDDGQHFFGTNNPILEYSKSGTNFKISPMIKGYSIITPNYNVIFSFSWK